MTIAIGVNDREPGSALSPRGYVRWAFAGGGAGSVGQDTIELAARLDAELGEHLA